MNGEMNAGKDTAGHTGVSKALRILVAGVASVAPVLATLWVLVLIYRILGRAGDRIIDAVFRSLNNLRGVSPRSADAWAFQFPGSSLVQALLPVAIVFALGFAVTNAPGRRLLGWAESKIQKLPLVGFIYGSVKQLVDAIKGMGAERKFKGVAYLEYPSPGCRLIGFITSNFTDPATGAGRTALFLPTSPNPLTGLVVIVEDSRVIPCEMTLEEAMKLVISAGLVAPGPGGATPPLAGPR